MKSLCDFIYEQVAKPINFIMEEGRMICSFQKDWTDLGMKFLLL